MSIDITCFDVLDMVLTTAVTIFVFTKKKSPLHLL